MSRHILTASRVFDGDHILTDHAVEIEHGLIRRLRPLRPDEAPLPGLLAPAFVDLQVNGGAGLMVDGALELAGLAHICDTHRRLGSAGILPTLITDRPEATAHVIALAIRAARADMPGLLGLHLEGPHLDPRRSGAHDPALIRPMAPQDLALLCDAAGHLPALMVTLAPEAASPAQIATLTRAGAIVSLGHSNCDYDTARAAMAAGAGCATHLFNAMSQMGHRQPGLVGAVLEGDCRAGLIADGIHIHPAALRTALAARDTGLFLVSDCMAFAGSPLQEMRLHGRQVRREGGRLTLPDGTLAGADLTLPVAVANLIRLTGTSPERALSMASSQPAFLLGQQHRFGRLEAGRQAQMVLLDHDFRLQRVWSGNGWLEG